MFYELSPEWIDSCLIQQSETSNISLARKVVLSSVISELIFIVILWGINYDYPYFTNEESLNTWNYIPLLWFVLEDELESFYMYRATQILCDPKWLNQWGSPDFII